MSTKETYHGSTLNSLAVGDRKHLKYLKYIYPKNHIKVNENDPVRKRKKNESEKDYVNRLIDEFKHKIKKYGSENICVYREPILGQLQGDINPAKNYWSQISKICKTNNIHLIMDEVYTGLGVCGKYNCTMWKKLLLILYVGKTLGAGYSPLSAVIMNKKVSEIIKKGSGRVSYSSTHQGHSLGISAALGVQQYIFNENLVERSNKYGRYMMRTLTDELKNLEYFQGVYGRGLRFSLFHQLGINSNFVKYLKKKMFNEHKILIDSKWHRIGFRTQMNLEKKIIDEILEKSILTFKKTINFI